MIIKSLFRRYERWNPVHPTYGAFSGIGVGIGCGVGWGPGFGPEVIGYVGAGCGAGFSVGITFLGFGIGRPANYLLEPPYNAFILTRRGALDVARASGLLERASRAGDRWGGSIRSHISDVQQNIRSSFFKIDDWMKNTIHLPNMKSVLVSNAKHITDRLQTVRGRFFPWNRGSKN
ncbi:hypothetical protein CDL12_24798 [Handroanthus impetiginosus]|uniref:Cadmium-induced protein AS8 n=1 Tax=Handroanthus impetiginosus TaxID=429701 RepID=A0A2G9GBL5_9LAMI|nr:hypothetical protein CDL12_24798 [Handroanthus impetiginosus]